MTEHPQEQQRLLGARHVASVVIGAIIGVGIFFTPATLARAVPSPTWALGIWLLGGLISVAGALVFADLGARWPRAGGLYVFLREGYRSSSLSFLYGWLQLLVVQPGAMAIIAVVLVDHVFVLTGAASPLVRNGLACGIIAVFAGANLLGIREGGRIQIAMASLKVCALVFLLGVGVVFGKGDHLAATAAVTTAGTWSSWILFGLIPILFTFGGAYHGTFIAGSVRDPIRAVPRGIILGIGVVLVLYLGVNIAYFALLGHGGLAASTSPASDAVDAAIGHGSGKIIAALIVVSAAGILNTVCLGFPFVIYAMAKDGVFPARAGRLDPRTGRPAFAVALQGALACIAVVIGSGSVDILLTGIAFADATFQAAIAIVHLRGIGSGNSANSENNAKPARQFAPAPIAWLFLFSQVGVSIGSVVRAPRESAYGVGALILGAIVWVVWRRRVAAS